MKVLICGSRSIRDLYTVEQAIAESGFTCTEIIHGGAFGVDSSAHKIALLNQIPVTVFKPDWNKYGRSAGIFRNKIMVNEADAVIAVWDGESKGTKFTIDFAEKQKKPVFLKQV